MKETNWKKRLTQGDELTREDLIDILSSKDHLLGLFKEAKKVKLKYIGDQVHLRGLIEFSNICEKDCYYCGIRKSNLNSDRFLLSHNDILESVRFACDNGYGSIVLQSGEIASPAFVNRVDRLVKDIVKMTGKNFGITLSCGEQKVSTFKKWFDSGATRYLLKIETSNKQLYNQIHPQNSHHIYHNRIESLKRLREIGYQVGTGIMVGLPGQNIQQIADDILFMKNIDMDMCGIGPYIEHHETPLYSLSHKLLPLDERFELTLKVIAILRIIMKDINIAASTALQSIDKIGREKALNIAANVFMPNITPFTHRNKFILYDNKPCTNEYPIDCQHCTIARIKLINGTIGFGEVGDSKHFLKRKNLLSNMN